VVVLSVHDEKLVWKGKGEEKTRIEVDVLKGERLRRR
jgi:hypothetical protein